jgi:gamma-glutamylcyclotransferase (GGCT)/AIG2-like uncharacterized protein YtfP
MSEQTGHMLYFAYGEDLPRSGFTRKFPGAEWFGPARLEGHRLVPNAVGLANVRAETGATVWGSLWLVPGSMLPALDAHAAEEYERTTRRIVSPAGPRTEATLYLSTASGKPAAVLAHLDVLLKGAKESRLPASYIKELSQAYKK